MTFQDILGQEPVKQHILRAVSAGNVSHAYLLHGEAGMGKRTMAHLFAKRLQCTGAEENSLEPCGKCTSCLQADSDSHPDIRILVPAKETSIGVDDIRTQVVEDSVLKPYASARKIYLIPEAHRMTVEAQNALLKTLEEPPSYCTIFLLSDNETAFLPTILSRVRSLPMRPVPDADINRYLMEVQRIPDYKAHLAVSFAQGNVGRALRLAGSTEFEERLRRTIALLSDIERLSISGMNERMQELVTGEAEKPEKAATQRAMSEFLEILRALLRDILVYKATGEAHLLIFAGELSYISKACETLSFADAAAVWQAVETASEQMKANANADIAVQLLLMKIQERIQVS